MKLNFFFLFFIFLLAFVKINGQIIKQDSLKKEIQSLIESNDPILSKKLTDLSVLYLNFGDIDSTEYYCLEAINVALKQKEKGNENPLLNLGISNGYRGLSEVKRLKGNVDSSKYFAIQSIKYAKNLNGEFINELGISYHLFALFFYDRAQYDSSLYYDLKALKIVTDIRDTSSIINYLSSISIYYDLLDQEYVAIEKLKLAKLLADNFNDANSSVHINLSLSKKIPELKSSLLKECYNLYDKVSEPYLKFNILNDLGKSFSSQGKIDSAEIMFDRAEDMSIKNNDLISLGAVKVNQIDLALIKNDISKVKKLLQEVEKIAIENENGNLQRTVYIKNIDLNKKIKNWESAFYWKNILYNFNDSLQNQKIKKEAFDKELTYKLDIEKVEFEKKNSLLKKEKQIQKIISTSTIVLLIVILIAIYLIWKRYILIRDQNVLIKEKSRLLKAQTDKNRIAQEEIHDLKIKQKQSDLEKSIANNKMMIAMKSSIINKLTAIKPNDHNQLKGIVLDLKQQLAIEEKVGLLEENNKDINSKFYTNLLSIGRLSKTELEVCSYIRLNLSTKEIAQLRGTTDASVRVSRSRIREKLSLTKEDNLYNFIRNV